MPWVLLPRQHPKQRRRMPGAAGAMGAAGRGPRAAARGAPIPRGGGGGGWRAAEGGGVGGSEVPPAQQRRGVFQAQETYSALLLEPLEASPIFLCVDGLVVKSLEMRKARPSPPLMERFGEGNEALKVGGNLGLQEKPMRLDQGIVPSFCKPYE